MCTINKFKIAKFIMTQRGDSMIRGDRLRKLRKEKNLSQKELGDLIGVKKSTICSYEKQTRTPTIENIIDLMQIFNVTSDYLIGADYLIKTFSNQEETITTLTKEEIVFLEELKKNKLVYNIIIADPKRTAELITTKIG